MEETTMTLKRRTVLKGLGSTIGATVGASSLAMPAIAQAAPFKIGLLTVKTGPLAQGGIQMEQGLLTFLKEKNNALNGRKIELVVADTGGNPAGAKTKTQELVERDKVNVILGPLAAFELLAITDYVKQNKTPLIAVAAAEDVTQRNANPYVIRPTTTSGQCCHVMADYAFKELGYKRAATISEDFAFGHEQMGAFQRVFEELGGKVVKKLWPPLVTPDYTPFIAQIEKVDCVFFGFAGSNPVKFMRAFNDIGAKAKFPLLAGWTGMDDALLKSLGDEAVGVLSAASYSSAFESEINKRFVDAMQKDYSVLAGGYASGMYIGGQCVEAALAIAGDKSNDGTEFADALHKVALKDSPRGPFSIDKYGNAVGNIFLRKCEKKDGQLVNTVLKTFPNVSQFWTYPDVEFLKNPVYSRDWPPAKNLE
jgi:branched-chain amino acid transport system substrate-binding protein